MTEKEEGRQKGKKEEGKTKGETNTNSHCSTFWLLHLRSRI
jgi:hypothetical protein